MAPVESNAGSTSIKVLYILTFANYITNFGNGIAGEMLPPGRLDIAELIGTDFENISYGQSCRSGGYIAGCILIGWLVTRMSRQSVLIASIMLGAGSILVTPFTGTLWLYLVIEGTFGIFTACMDVATNSWLLEIWRESANPYMQGMHFCYATGQMIAPLMVEPYLSFDKNVTDVSGNSTTIHEETRITIPYTIGALVLFLVGVLILVLYYKVPYTDPKRTTGSKRGPGRDYDNNNINGEAVTGSDLQRLIPDPSKEEKTYTIQMIVLACFLFLFSSGVELSTLSFLPEFVLVIDLRLGKSKAAFLSSVMSAAFAVTRLLSIGIAVKLKTRTMLYIHFSMLVIGNMILLLFANTSELSLWIAVVIIGAGQSCVYPCLMSLLEEKINVTTGICSIFSLATAIVNCFIPIIMGKFIENYPMTYVYVNLFGIFNCFVFFIALNLIDQRFRRSQRHVSVRQ